MDLVKRIAAALHIFNHFALELLNRRKPNPPAMRITARAVHRAASLVHFADSQKEIVIDVRPLTIYMTINHNNKTLCLYSRIFLSPSEVSNSAVHDF